MTRRPVLPCRTLPSMPPSREVRPRRALPRLLLAAGILAGSLSAPGLAAQDAAPSLAGQVVLAGEPVSDVMVTLHRVTLEESGPVDSLRTNAGGNFRFVLPSQPIASGSHQVYFASVSVDDVMYFGPPIADAAALDSLYRIEAFPSDTVGATAADLPLTVRNMFIDPTGAGDWFITDLLEVRNDGVTTLVSDGNHPVFSYPLPAGASQFEVGQSDLAEDATSFEGGTLHVKAPVPPGERTFLIRYRMPNLNFTVPLPGSTAQFEVLAREPVDLTVQGLVAQQPKELEPGQTYVHFLGTNLQNTQIVLAGRAGGGSGGFRAEWLAVIVALVMGGGGILAWHRGQSGPRPAPATGFPPSSNLAGAAGAERAALLMEIATLDEAYESIEEPTAEETQRYRSYRAVLTGRLVGRNA